MLEAQLDLKLCCERARSLGEERRKGKGKEERGKKKRKWEVK
jgi:hypothetical protein